MADQSRAQFAGAPSPSAPVDVGKEIGSGAYNALNTALLGIPTALIEAAGGKGAVLDFIRKKGIGADIGKGVGAVGGAFIPGLGVVGKLKGIGGLAANVGLGVGEEAIREGLAGENVTPASLGAAAAGGGLGYGAGKLIGALGKGIQKPTEEVIKDIIQRADKDVLAGVLGTRTKDLLGVMTGDVGLASHQRIEDVVKTGADVARKYKATSMKDSPRIMAAMDNEFAKLDKTGVTLAKTMNGKPVIDPSMRVKINPEVEKKINELSSVKAIRALDAKRMGLKDSSFDDTLQAAMAGVDGNPATIRQSMRVLSDQAGSARRMGANYGGKNKDVPDTAMLYAQALNDARHELMAVAAKKAEVDLETMSKEWPVRLLMEKALQREAARITPVSAGSGTGTNAAITAAMNLAHPVAGAASVIGAVAREPVNAAIAGMRGQMKAAAGLVAPAKAAAPLGRAGIAAKRELTGAAPLGGALGGALAGGQTALAQNASDVGAGSALGTPPEKMPAATPQEPSEYSPNFDTGGQNQYGYKANALDEAIDKNMRQSFILQGGGLYAGERQEEEFQNFKNAVYKGIHGPDGSLNPAIAARIIFPGQVENQQHFESLVSLVSSLGESMQGMEQQVGPGAAVSRLVNPDLNMKYNTLKGLIEKLPIGNTQGIMEAFDRAMILPSGQDRRKMILDAIKMSDRTGVQLLQQAGINLW